MTIFEKIKAMNIDELAKWLDEQCPHDVDPCVTWWDNTYCKNCESVTAKYDDSCIDMEFAWCELHGKCRFFQDMDEVPDTVQITKMWLESEVQD